MATDQASVPDVYDDLLERYRQISYLDDANMVLSWDQEVMMPEGGTPARSKQRAAVSAVSHDRFVDDQVGAWLDELEDAALPDAEAATVREIRRQYDRKARVPTDLVEEISEATSDAHPVWKDAKANDDFASFAPTLERLLELKREYAAEVEPDADPYEALFADYEPYLELETAERILGELREALVPLVDAIRDSDVALATDAFEGTFPVDDQRALARETLELLGYDFEHGRLDEAPHPFSSGTPYDARVTTRFDETDPLSAIGSTIHEFGHATYTLGLDKDAYGSPLGQHRGLTVHESQSRLWENHVGRTRAFWEQYLPLVQEHLPGTEDLTVEAAYEAANQVYEDNLIRVEADELTYHMHIVLRFEIERDLLEGDLDVEAVPPLWNDKMETYLGLRPDTDAEGCLQDIHWSHGSFGYFPTYSLGSVLAAQLYAAADEDIEDLDGKIEAGEFGPLHEWLTDNVHAHGQRYPTDELIEWATGEPFTAEYFVDYVTEKYSALYDLDL